MGATVLPFQQLMHNYSAYNIYSTIVWVRISQGKQPRIFKKIDFTNIVQATHAFTTPRISLIDAAKRKIWPYCVTTNA